MDFEPIVSSRVTFTSGSRVNRQIISIISSSSTEAKEYFGVSLDIVLLLNSTNGSSLFLSEQEKARLVLNPRVANITIEDSNGTCIPYVMNTSL